MRSSFNAFGTSKAEYGQLHVPIWLGVVGPVPIGGTLDRDYLLPGLLIPGGSPVNLTNKVITPFVAFEVVDFEAGDGTTVTVDTITIKPAKFGNASILPEVGDFIQKLGETFDSKGKAAAVAGISAGEAAGTYDVTVAHSATVDTPSEGDFIVFSAATAAGSSKSIAVKPNGYLYNDICMGDIDTSLDDAAATGAVVKFHADGILIDLTASAEFKEQMAVAVPHVLQVSA